MRLKLFNLNFVKDTSIIHRLSLTVTTNFFKSGLNFLTGIIIARVLGPSSYGEMVYLLSTFEAVRSLFDMGSSQGFFTFASREPVNRLFVKRYLYWILIQIILPFIAIALLFPSDWVQYIWKSEDRHIVILALLAMSAQQIIWGFVTQLGESKRMTYSVQSMALIISVLHLTIIGSIWLLDIVSLKLIFFILMIEWSLASVIIWRKVELPTSSSSLDNLHTTLSLYVNYCRPLVVYAWIGFAYTFIDRFMLQHYSGSIEQAYYGIADKFCVFIYLFTGALLNILWKETAEAYHENDYKKLNNLYEKSSKGIFFLASYLASLFIPWSEDVVQVALGEEFKNGAVVVSVMLLYPIHQALGTVGAVFAFTTGRSKIRVNVNTCMMLSGIPLTYYILSGSISFLPTGALGLALKTIVLQFLFVNAQNYFVLRSLGVKCDLMHQLVFVPLIIVGFSVKHFVDIMSYSDMSVVWGLALAASLHTVFSFVLLVSKPELAGTNRQEMQNFFKIILKRTPFV